MPDQISLQICFNGYVLIKSPLKLAYLMLVDKQMVLKFLKDPIQALTVKVLSPNHWTDRESLSGLNSCPVIIAVIVFLHCLFV